MNITIVSEEQLDPLPSRRDYSDVYEALQSLSPRDGGVVVDVPDDLVNTFRSAMHSHAKRSGYRVSVYRSKSNSGQLVVRKI